VDPRTIERLKWRSRRGLLELDLVMGRAQSDDPGIRAWVEKLRAA
jgi:succinate dehydrogenase flavin-adding protein (antitoxin of CptAB toxin-antitoxin module)